MSPCKLDKAVLEVMREMTRSKTSCLEKGAGRRAIRNSVGCTSNELADALYRLRNGGFLEFDRLALRASTLNITPVAPQPTPVPAVTDQAKRDAAQALALAPLTLAHRIQLAGIDEPNDVMALVSRKWPELRQAIADRARRTGVSPVSELFDAIERGLA